MNKEQALQKIEELKKFIEKEDKKQRFAEVQFSDKEYILLKDKEGFGLVKTWIDKDGLNDFDYFEQFNKGTFWIQGNVKPFEIFLNETWVRCDDRAPVRFLNE